MPVRRRAQTHMDDRHIEDPELLELLDRREDAIQQMKELKGPFADLDRQAKGLIQSKGIEGTVRCGPFIITVGQRAPKDIAFTTKSGTRIDIRNVATEAAEGK